jgi:pimeloyl-ACP methyl ester carboxylesterase
LENGDMASIEVGPQTLHFEDTGGAAPAVLFCHITMNGAMFSPQLTAFAGRYRCITWDQRGHGQSPASGPFTLWDSARDALAQARAREDQTCHTRMRLTSHC